ncbi:MAG: hypothetical protein Q4F00_12265 [bacterium]|nr:hypothetical protein [bacterium]
MSFWEQMRQEVRERTTTGDVSTELFETVMSTGVSSVAVIQPTFYLGRFFILSCDFMGFVEKFLDDTSEADAVLRNILYIRETASTMGRCIRNVAEPMDGMLNFLDPIYEKSYACREMSEHICDDEECGCHDGEADLEAEEEDDEDLDDEFLAECTALSGQIKEKLCESGVTERVSSELAQRLSQTYSCCVTYVRELRKLHKTEPAQDISSIMVSLIDLQYIMDTKLRRLLLEDVFMEKSPAFSTGLMPWISHCVEELAHKVSAKQSTVAG